MAGGNARPPGVAAQSAAAHKVRAMKPIHVIGGGLAGSEAAWQIARRAASRSCSTRCGRSRRTEAHKTDGLAELVCSNSFRSDDRETNAVGLLHEELRRAGSLIMRTGDAHQVPAGGALAVDRDGFSAAVSEALARASAGHHRARRGRRPAAGRLGQRHRRDRAAHLAGAGRGDPRASPARTSSPSSMRSRRSSISTRSTWTSPGSSRATTSRARAAPAPTTSTAR